jgi:hypothetical protein
MADTHVTLTGNPTCASPPTAWGLSNPGELGQETRIRQLVERCQVQSALQGASP